MTDLTKEDLKLILKWRDEVKYTKQPTQEMIASNERLGERIKGMIENYCEHIWTDGSGNVMFCGKCQILGNRK